MPIMREGFWVYITSVRSGTLYTGMTNSIDRRVYEHKQHLIPGFSDQYGCTRTSRNIPIPALLSLVRSKSRDSVRKEDRP